MGALLACLDRQNKMDAWGLYMASLIGRAMGARPFTDLIGIKPEDTRTGDEIISGLAEKLRRRKGARR